MARTPSTLWPVLAFHMLAARGPLTSNCGVSPRFRQSVPGEEPAPPGLEITADRHGAPGEGQGGGGDHVGEVELTVGRGDDPGLHERARARPHFGVVARQEEVGRRVPAGWWRPTMRLPTSAARVVRICVRSPERCCARGRADRSEPWSGPKLTPSRARWVDAASEASCCRAATRSRPGRVREAQQCLGSADGADADVGHLLGRSRQVLHRAELATGDRKDVDRPEQGRRQQAVRAAEARLRPSGGTRRARRTGCRRPRGPAGPTARPPRRGGCGRRPPPRR